MGQAGTTARPSRADDAHVDQMLAAQPDLLAHQARAAVSAIRRYAVAMFGRPATDPSSSS
jgi:hypothetical protein